MAFRLLLLLTALLLSPLAVAQEDCTIFPPIPGNLPGFICPNYHLLSGVRCEGDYCERVWPRCCRYLPDKYKPTNSSILEASPGHGGVFFDQRWTPWYSEEERSGKKKDENRLIAGIACRGDHCDDLRLLLSSPGATVGGACTWVETSEEDSAGAQCAPGYYVNEIECDGRYCDNLNVQCCPAKYTPPHGPPGGISGERCVTLPKTGRGFSVMAEATPSAISTHLPFLNAERPKDVCPNGMALRGLQCFGHLCTELKPTCCSYGGLEKEYGPKTTFKDSKRISEEEPNTFEGNHEVLMGVRCSGNYCDNVSGYLMKNPHLEVTNNCDYTPAFSEENGPAMCPAGYFGAGLSCYGSNCDQLKLRCCYATWNENWTPLTPFIQTPVE